jgi:hypothetical protein
LQRGLFVAQALRWDRCGTRTLMLHARGRGERDDITHRRVKVGVRFRWLSCRFSFHPRVTTWIGFPRDMVLRRFMVDFIHLFAPHYSPRLIRDAAESQTQEQLELLIADMPLPVRGGCEQDAMAAA